MPQPVVNREGEWIIYRRRDQRVEEHKPGEALKLLVRGSHVVAPGAQPADFDVRELWTISGSPEAYLKRYPTGPNAFLAHAVVQATKAHVEGAE